MTGQSTITLGRLARDSGCDRETVRYYERIGLLPCPARNAAGYRLYGDEDVRRLAFVRRCRGLGFHVDEIRELLALADHEEPGCGEVSALTARHLAEVRAKLAELRRMERTLRAMVAACEDNPDGGCPAIASLLDP